MYSKHLRLSCSISLLYPYGKVERVGKLWVSSSPWNAKVGTSRQSWFTKQISWTTRDIDTPNGSDDSWTRVWLLVNTTLFSLIQSLTNHCVVCPERRATSCQFFLQRDPAERLYLRGENNSLNTCKGPLRQPGDSSVLRSYLFRHLLQTGCFEHLYAIVNKVVIQLWLSTHLYMAYVATRTRTYVSHLCGFLLLVGL